MLLLTIESSVTFLFSPPGGAGCRAARRSGGAPLPDIRAGTGNLAAKSREFATLINVFWVFTTSDGFIFEKSLELQLCG